MKWVSFPMSLAILLPSANGPYAHYAKFCVDAELLTSFGWIEAIGLADRSAFDLSCHTTATGVPLVVRELRKEPLTVTEFVVETQMAKFGPRFKKNGKAVQLAIDRLTQDVKEKLSLELKENGKITIDVPGVGDGKVELTSGTKSAPHKFSSLMLTFEELIKIEQQTRTEHIREFIPNVIEPSFVRIFQLPFDLFVVTDINQGIGRIL